MKAATYLLLSITPLSTSFSPSSLNRRLHSLKRKDAPPSLSFAPSTFMRRNNNLTILKMAKENGEPIGIFFGTSTGATQTVADMIAEEFGPGIASEPIEIDSIQGSVAKTFAEYDALVVGTPTWNTGADTERSGTGWDEVYYGEMQDIDIKGKKVAVFGLGDSVSYSENYADASGELHDVFESLGCKMMGYTSQEGYEHEESKAVRGDLFCGLLCDQVNQEDLTEERVKNWVAQLKEEGILEGGSSSAGEVSPTETSSVAPVAPAVVEVSSPSNKLTDIEVLEENSRLLDSSIATGTNDDDSAVYIPHRNPKSGVTMWTSRDGRTCYYTIDSAVSSFKP